MFNKYFIGLALGSALALMACSTASQVCLKPEAKASIICPVLAKAGTTPESVNVMFKLANVEFIRMNVYAKADVLKFFDNVESVLNSDTYAELSVYMLFEVANINNKYAAELVIFTDAFDMFKKIELPISQFDIDMLKEHIKQQRQILTLVQ